MAIKTYKNNDKTKLNEYLNVQNFKCKCGKKHDILIDEALIKLLFNLAKEFENKYKDKVIIHIKSGYRCPSHDKKVGGSGKGSHTKGQASDTWITLAKTSKVIPSDEICLTLEDMGHNKGIGYRCGGVKNEKGITHIDTKNRKWYGDESKSFTKQCCTSFYKYFKKSKKYSKGTYKVISPRYIRDGAGTEYRIKKVHELTIEGQLNCVDKNKNANAQYKKNTKFTAKEIHYAKNGSIWGKSPSGYICICSKLGKEYCKKS